MPTDKLDAQINAHHNSDALVLFSIAMMSTIVNIFNRITSQMYNLITAVVWNWLTQCL